MDDTVYYPIRQRMVWVAIIQSVVAALVLAGVSAEVLQGWVAWGVSLLDVLVLVGVLSAGTKAAEQNTTPLDNAGRPLNPVYAKVALETGGTPPASRKRPPRG